MDIRITPSDDLQQQNRCAHCKRPLQITSSPSSVIPCGNCRKVFYCSVTHMTTHSSKHEKSGCFPAIIQSSAECGRYWVAARDILMDEVIYTDRAIVLSPNVPLVSCASSLYPTCLGCSRATNTTYRCSKCTWPTCSRKCEKLAVHSKNECKVFRKNRVQSNCRPQYYFFIQFLRSLLLREQDPESFSELIQLESHIDRRKKVKEEVFMLKSFYRFLTEECNLWQYDLQLVDHIVGVNRVNCYSADGIINGKKRFCSAVFPKLSLINHNCNPNTRTILHEESGTFTLLMELRASIDIRQGEEISQQYITSTKGTLTRQKLLSDWYFNCGCERCQDVTEFNTYFSAIKCVNCSNGYLLPLNPLQYDSPWQCGIISPEKDYFTEMGCGYNRSGENVKALFENTEKEIELYEYDPKAMEKLLCDLSLHSLHPNHYLVINIKYGILDGIVKKLNYSSAQEHTIGFVDDGEISKGIEIAKSILSVTRVICPGRSYCVGVILYFLSCCLVELKVRKVQTKFSDNQVESFIKEAWAILNVEADGSKYKEMSRLLEEKSLVLNMSSLSF